MQFRWLAGSILIAGATLASVACANDAESRREREKFWRAAVQVGARLYYLLDGMDPGKLKSRLEKCKNAPFCKTDFLDRPSQYARDIKSLGFDIITWRIVL